MDLKYDILKHPNIKLSADGGAEPYDHTRPNYSIGSFRFDRDVLKLEPFEITDEVGEFAILTEEEIEEETEEDEVESKQVSALFDAIAEELEWDFDEEEEEEIELL